MMIDLVTFLAALLLGRDGAVEPLRPAPYTAPAGHAEVIPDPLPYVLGEQQWGPQ